MIDRIIAQRGALTQKQWISLQGFMMRAFHVLNRKGKTLAIGAVPLNGDSGFCVMQRKRYERDFNLVRAVESLTGIPVRLHYWEKGRKGHANVLGVIQ
jgi:hypothetical protein